MSVFARAYVHIYLLSSYIFTCRKYNTTYNTLLNAAGVKMLLTSLLAGEYYLDLAADVISATPWSEWVDESH